MGVYVGNLPYRDQRDDLTAFIGLRLLKWGANKQVLQQTIWGHITLNSETHSKPINNNVIVHHSVSMQTTLLCQFGRLPNSYI